MNFELLAGTKKYLINRDGIIKRIKRNGNTIVVKVTYTGSKGYPTVKLNGKNYYMHRLIASMYIPNPDIYTYTIVHHKDGDILNFAIDNLEWLKSQAEHLGLHILDIQKDINQPSEAKQYKMLQVHNHIKQRFMNMKNGASVNDYLTYLMDGE